MPRRYEQEGMVESQVHSNNCFEKISDRTVFTATVSSKGPIWLVTFVDLISLLLVFFIMLYSMSSLHSSPWKKFMASLNDTKFEKLNKNKQEIHSPVTGESPLVNKGLSVSYLQRILEAGLASESSLNGAFIKQEKEKLFISLPYDLFFVSNSNKINPTGTRALFAISETLSSIRNRIEIVGRADANIVSHNIAENDWTRSLAKAVSVGEALIRSGYSKPLAVRADLKKGEEFERQRLNNNEKHSLSSVDLIIYSDRDSQ